MVFGLEFVTSAFWARAVNSVVVTVMFVVWLAFKVRRRRNHPSENGSL